MEKWNTIKGYESYEISNLGNVISYKRNQPKLMKPSLGKRGYLSIGLTNNSFEKKYKVHQLVAMAFLNHKPNGVTIVVDHINNNKLDNRIENLQLISQHRNTIKNSRKGTSKYVGVSWVTRDQKWNARITINGNYKSLGNYTDEFEAHLAYQRKLEKIM